MLFSMCSPGTWHLAPGQVESLQEVEERLGDLEAEHDYLIEADPRLHKPSSHNQQVEDEEISLIFSGLGGEL